MAWARRKLLIAGAAVLLVGGAVAGPLLTNLGSAAGPRPANALPPATAPITRTTLVETKSVSGTLGRGDLTSVSAAGSGTLTWIAPVGSTVERGESLYRVDERPVVALYGAVPLYRMLSDVTALAEGSATAQSIVDAQNALSTATSNLRAAEARLEQLRAGPTAANLAAAEQAVVSAQAALQRAEADLARVQAGATSEELFQAELALEQAKNSLWAQQLSRDATCGRDQGGCEAANASVAAAETNVKRAQATLDALLAKPDRRDVEAAQAAVASARASLRAAQAKLDETRQGPPEQDLLQAQASLDSARANYQSARARLEEMGIDGIAQGTDVLQLQENLAALGYTGYSIDGIYTSDTAEAVRAWQADLGLPQTGVIEPGQVVFTPGPVQVAEHTARVGDPVRGTPVLSYTGTDRLVTVPLAVADLALVSEGQEVTVRIPGQDEVAGEIVRIGSSVRNGAVEAIVTIADQAALGTLDAATVDVDFVSRAREDVLTVPVNALLALAEGGYGVEIVEGGTTRIVAVRTGMFARGRVEITGEGIAEGMMVGAPR